MVSFFRAQLRFQAQRADIPVVQFQGCELRRGRACRPFEATPPWKLVDPYRGFEAMNEANADYFYGRDLEAASVLNALASKPGRCPTLIGASASRRWRKS